MDLRLPSTGPPGEGERHFLIKERLKRLVDNTHVGIGLSTIFATFTESSGFARIDLIFPGMIVMLGILRISMPVADV
jgi:hypothetical protein